MNKHFSKWWPTYFYSVSIMFMLLITVFISEIFRLTQLPFIIYQFIGTIVCLWWMAHIIEALKIENVILKTWNNKPYKKVLLSSLMTVSCVGIFAFDNIEMAAITDTLLGIIIAYYWAITMYQVVIKIKFWQKSRKKYFSEKQYKRITTYMQEHNHFFIADHNIHDIYSLKINFPGVMHDEISEMLQFFLNNPKIAWLISKIFKDHITVDSNNNLYIDDKLETNPSKIGFFILNKMSDYSKAEINVNIIDPTKS